MSLQSEELTTVNQQCYGAVIDQGNLHVGLKSAGLDGDPQAADLGNELQVEPVGQFRWGRSCETWTAALTTIGEQRELADCEYRPADLGQGQVHLAGFIFKDPKSHDLARDGNCIRWLVVDGDSEQHQKASGDLPDRFPVDGDFGLTHSLNNRAHGTPWR